MKKDQINKILINIVTVGLGLGVIVFGYFSFISKDSVVKDSVAVVADIAVQTTSIGADIDNTVRVLNDLSRAVALSTAIFELPTFKSLQNFTVPVSAEPVGRLNPFVPTEWKLKMRALEESSKSVIVAPQAISPAPLVSSMSTKENEDFFGNFAGGL